MNRPTSPRTKTAPPGFSVEPRVEHHRNRPLLCGGDPLDVGLLVRGGRREHRAQQVAGRLLVERGEQVDAVAAQHRVAAVVDHEQAPVGAQERRDVAAVGGAAHRAVDGLGERDVALVALAHGQRRLADPGVAGGVEAGVRLEAGAGVGAQRPRIGRGEDDRAPLGRRRRTPASARAARGRRRGTGTRAARRAATGPTRPRGRARARRRPSARCPRPPTRRPDRARTAGGSARSRASAAGAGAGGSCRR